MEWFYPRRGPDWKQGSTGQTLASFTLPPVQLLAIFAIVIFLLSLSQSTNFKEQLHHSVHNFQLFLFSVPILLIFFIRSSFRIDRFNVWVPWPIRDSIQRAGGFPWGIAILVGVLLVLLSYQSSFRSTWFGPLRRLDL